MDVGHWCYPQFNKISQTPSKFYQKHLQHVNVNSEEVLKDIASRSFDRVVDTGQRALQYVQILFQRLGDTVVGLIVALQQSDLLTPGLSLASKSACSIFPKA